MALNNLRRAVADANAALVERGRRSRMTIVWRVEFELSNKPTKTGGAR